MQEHNLVTMAGWRMLLHGGLDFKRQYKIDKLKIEMSELGHESMVAQFI